jgi:hypothetical protein
MDAGGNEGLRELERLPREFISPWTFKTGEVGPRSQT